MGLIGSLCGYLLEFLELSDSKKILGLIESSAISELGDLKIIWDEIFLLSIYFVIFSSGCKASI